MDMIFKNFKEFINIRLPFVANLYKSYKNREKRISYGNENPDKIFYVYGVPDNSGGLWWHINKVLMHIGYAEDHGYIPIVDMKNYKNQYLEENELGRINVWEVFFEQPAGYSLSDIACSKNIILSKKAPSPTPRYLMGQYPFYEDDSRIKYFHELFKKHIRFNLETQTHLEKIYQQMFAGKGKVVGVLCRGTDYVKIKPKGHPIQPNPEDVIVDVHKVMIDYRCNYVFLATEDADVLNRFKVEFGEKLLYVNQKRVSKNEMGEKGYLAAINQQKNKGLDTFSKGIGYLSATYLLSKCNCYIAGRTGGSKGVLIMSEGFEYKKLYDLGLYE
jgi:hypothetical protein